MSVISICCHKDDGNKCEPVANQPYIPAAGYMHRIAEQVKPWHEGADLYFYAESHNGLDWTGLALFMALAELQAIKETGAYFSFFIDEQDFAARQLFYDHYHRLGTTGRAMDAQQAIDFIFNQLTQFRQMQGGENIADWYGYVKFVQNKVCYAHQVCVMIKPTASVEIAVPADKQLTPGLVVLAKRPRNQCEQLQQLQQGAMLLEVS